MKLALLGSDDWESTVELHLSPGDTLEQAKVLYAEPLHLERLLSLRSLGWFVRPNFLRWTFNDEYSVRAQYVTEPDPNLAQYIGKGRVCLN